MVLLPRLPLVPTLGERAQPPLSLEPCDPELTQSDVSRGLQCVRHGAKDSTYVALYHVCNSSETFQGRKRTHTTVQTTARAHRVSRKWASGWCRSSKSTVTPTSSPSSFQTWVRSSINISSRLSFKKSVCSLKKKKKSSCCCHPLASSQWAVGNSLVLSPNSIEKANMLCEETKTGENGSNERGCETRSETKGNCKHL